MRVFVTGAASPLGRALVTALQKRGDRVVGLVRRHTGVSLLQNLGVETVVGDIRRPDALARTMKGCDAVFHLASFFDFWARRPEIFDDVNVQGTKNAVAAAIVAGVPRVVLCSSAVTIGEPAGDVGHEWTKHRGHTLTAFEQTKLAAERLALRLRSKGIQLVVANPALVVAPEDAGWVGRTIARCVAGRTRLASDAPLGWVWVDDAAEGLLRVFQRGVDGGRYILCGDTLSARQFLSKVARIAGRQPPLPFPPSFLSGGAALSTAIAAPVGRRPRLARDEARFLATGLRVDGSYAQQLLGLDYTPLARYLPFVVENYRKKLSLFS